MYNFNFIIFIIIIRLLLFLPLSFSLPNFCNALGKSFVAEDRDRERERGWSFTGLRRSASDSHKDTGGQEHSASVIHSGSQCVFSLNPSICLSPFALCVPLLCVSHYASVCPNRKPNSEPPPSCCRCCEAFISANTSVLIRNSIGPKSL